MTCPICAGTNLTEVYEVRDPRFRSPERFKIMWCDTCATASTQPRMSLDELASYYPDEYDPYREDLFLRTSSRVHRLFLSAEERFSPGETDNFPVGSLLDVGCGNGQYLAAMARRGFTVTGVELSAVAAKVASARGLRVLTGDFLRISFPEERFDVVTMNHYLEHSLDPQASLEKAFSVLRPSGRLVIGVPNFSSWARRYFGPDWSDLEAPRHVSHFTPEGLTRLLTRSGFRVDQISYAAAADSASIVTSLLVKARMRDDPLGQRLFPFLHALAYPIGLPLAATGRSAWMRVFASKGSP